MPRVPPFRRRTRSLGTSNAVERLRAELYALARYQDTHALVLGETGSGQDLVARTLHDIGATRHAPFVPLRWRGGHREAGGRRRRRRGRRGEGRHALPRPHRRAGARRAASAPARPDGEAHALPRGGGGATIRARARVRAAPRALQALSRVTLHTPPLRDRREDIPVLSAYFVYEACAQHGVRAEIKRSALRRLASHEWPGNVRELRSVVTQATLQAEDGTVDAAPAGDRDFGFCDGRRRRRGSRGGRAPAQETFRGRGNAFRRRRGPVFRRSGSVPSVRPPQTPSDARSNDGTADHLCGSCRHVRRLGRDGGPTYFLCTRHRTDPRFARYPRIPVRRCCGFAAAPDAPV